MTTGAGRGPWLTSEQAAVYLGLSIVVDKRVRPSHTPLMNATRTIGAAMKTTNTAATKCPDIGSHILGTLPGSCPTCMMAYGEMHRQKPTSEEYERAMRQAAAECGCLEWWKKASKGVKP